MRSSTLEVEGGKTDLLVAITRRVGGTVYMAGGGAGGYQDDAMFAEAGLGVVYQAFRHPTYPQHGVEAFVPGQSILDVLFNVGFQHAGRLLRECRDAAATS